MDTERTLKLPRAEELREFICYRPDDDDDDADGDYDDNGEDDDVLSRCERPLPRASAEFIGRGYLQGHESYERKNEAPAGADRIRAMGTMSSHRSM